MQPFRRRPLRSALASLLQVARKRSTSASPVLQPRLMRTAPRRPPTHRTAPPAPAAAAAWSRSSPNSCVLSAAAAPAIRQWRDRHCNRRTLLGRRHQSRRARSERGTGQRRATAAQPMRQVLSARLHPRQRDHCDTAAGGRCWECTATTSDANFGWDSLGAPSETFVTSEAPRADRAPATTTIASAV